MLSNVRDCLRSNRKISAGYHPTVHPMRLSGTKRFQNSIHIVKWKIKIKTALYNMHNTSRKTNLQSLKSNY